jgi:hypothetical protein
MTMPEAKRQEMFYKNNELFAIFMQHVLDNPDLLDQIPDSADIIFLPDSDPALRQANLELGQEREREGAQVTFYIEMVPEVGDTSESRTCSGSSRRTPNKLGSPTLDHAKSQRPTSLKQGAA